MTMHPAPHLGMQPPAAGHAGAKPRRLMLSECASTPSVHRASLGFADSSAVGSPSWHSDLKELYCRVCDVLFEPAFPQDVASLVQALQAAGDDLPLGHSGWFDVLDFIFDEIGVLSGDPEVGPWTEQQLQCIYGAFEYVRYAGGGLDSSVDLKTPFLVCSTAGPEHVTSAPPKPSLSLSDCASSSQARRRDRRSHWYAPSSAETRSLSVAKATVCTTEAATAW